MSGRPLSHVSILPRAGRVVARACRFGLFIGAACLAPTLHADVTEVDEAALSALMEAGATIVDVRREDEWRERGVLEGSHPLTFFDASGGYDIDAWLDALGTLVSPDETVVLICAHGVRSKRIADLLDSRLGFSAVHNITDGIEGWRAAGGEVTPFEP